MFTYLHWVRGLRYAKNREGGFTLLEIIISLAIIATAIVALLSLQSRSMSMMKSAEMFEGARLLAERFMAEGELKGVPNGEIKGGNGPYNWTLTEMRLTPDSMPEGVKALTGRQVSFDILWMEGKKEERLSFAEYIYER
jgi:prepilin-type N-terminal cleavage/methylation domain-containing protein